jgi:hypothetical protein
VRYPPGNPLILAGIFAFARIAHIDQAVSLSIFSLLFTGAAMVILFQFVSRALDHKIAWVTVLLTASYPFQLWLTKQPNSELPFMVLFFGALTAFWPVLTQSTTRWKHAFLSGVLCGAASLIRPFGIGLPFVLAGLLLIYPSKIWRRRLLTGFLVVAGFIVTILPWEVIMYRHTGQIIPISTAGAESLVDGWTFGASKDYARPDQFSPEIRAMMGRLLEGKYKTTSALAHAVLQEFNTHPGLVLQFIGLKIVRSLYGTDSGRLETANMLVQIFYLLGVIAGIVVLFIHRPQHNAYLLLNLTMVLYFWGMTVYVLSILRYMVPVMALPLSWMAYFSVQLKPVNKVLNVIFA